MTRGLVRDNNLSDLADPIRARENLGLAAADYDSMRGLSLSAGVTNTDVQRIANSAGPYQPQLNAINVALSGVVPSLYASRSGDTISGTWTNTGYIQASGFIQSGTTLGASSDALFSLTVSGLSFTLSTSGVTMNQGLTVQSFSNSGNTVAATGVTTNKLVPFKVNGVAYFLEAG